MDTATSENTARDRIDWLRCIPFILLHLACAGALFVGWSPVAVAVAVALYALRMFLITGFYHRYFSHRSFRTSRWLQFLAAVGACSSAQRGPLWWAGQHRHHHRNSDAPPDAHSPRQHGFLYSHMGWFMTRRHHPVPERLVRDWARYPELRWLDRHDMVPPIVLAGATYALGAVLARYAPELGTSGPQMLIWGFVISTIVLYHCTYTINSLAHQFGSRRFNTDDDSRNNLPLAILTFGEGWHNNHHHYPASTRQGFVWWEVDLTYYLLVALSRLGLVWGLKPVPRRVLAQASAKEH